MNINEVEQDYLQKYNEEIIESIIYLLLYVFYNTMMKIIIRKLIALKLNPVAPGQKNRWRGTRCMFYK